MTTDFTAGVQSDAGALMWVNTLEPGMVSIRAANGYDLYTAGPDGNLGLEYALPVWLLREAYVDAPTTAETDMVRYTARTWFDGNIDGFVDPGAELRFRPLHLNTQLGLPVLPRRYRSGGSNILVDPAAIPGSDGHIAAGPELGFSASASGGFTIDVSLPPTDTPGYAHWAGGVVYEVDDAGEPEPGLHWSFLADNSWSYADFGRDLPAGPDAPTKTFSREQLARWFAATTTDPEQPVFVFYYFAIEDLTLEQFTANIRAMVEQTEGAGADAGLGRVHHCFVVPHFHILGATGERRPELWTRAFDAAVGVAQDRDDMSVVSIYGMTDGVLFDGSPEAQDWLLARGHDHTVYGDRVIDYLAPGVEGDLLDGNDLHPDTGRDGSFLFAWYAARAIIEACPADFASPYGQLDLGDINRFAGLFLAGEPGADLAAPFGTIDLADVSAFVESFLAGCHFYEDLCSAKGNPGSQTSIRTNARSVAHVGGPSEAGGRVPRSRTGDF